MDAALDDLRTDLLARWKAAFARISEVETGPTEAVETVYTAYPAYALSGYLPKKFKPGARVSRSPSADGDDYVFQRDEHGRPLTMRKTHRVNRLDWRGVYHYGAEAVERIEFCMQTGVPSLYERLVLDGRNVLAQQRFVCNEGGSNKRRKTAAQILANPHAYFLYLTRYHIEGGVITSAEELHEVGGELQRPTLEHVYAAGKLARIVRHWPDGERQTVFAAKTKTTLAALSKALSRKIADAVLTQLASASFDAPLVALELNYREGDQPIPMLVPLTERDRVESLALVAQIPQDRFIILPPEDFAPEITELEQRVESTSNAVAVPKMLRQAARLVTETRPLPASVAEGFVAFAIDWELEGDELAKILKQCGAPRTKIAEWKKKGWL